MDIRLEDMVLHITSGLKQQWQFSPWIMSHRFQLPLRWYACVRLIRYTFMSSATKHLASQRDAHLLLRTIRPLAAWRNVSWASSPRPLLSTSCSVVDVDCQCTHRGSYGNGGGSSLCHHDSYYEHTVAASLNDCDSSLSELRCGGTAEAKKPLYKKEAVIWSCPVGTNGVSVTWTIIFTVCPAAGVSFPFVHLVYIRWHLQISGAAIV